MASNYARDPGYKQALRKLFVDLPSKIQRPEAITKILYSKGILGDQDFARLRTAHQNHGASVHCEELILVMREKTKNEIEKFLDILMKDNQQEVVDLIREAAAECEPDEEVNVPVQVSEALSGATMGAAGGTSRSCERLAQQPQMNAPPLEVISSLNTTSEIVSTNKKPFTILVLGKSGEGKSCLCNKLSNSKLFNSSGKTGQVTKELKVVNKRSRGRELKIVDSPGTMDTENQKEAVVEIAKAITASPDGYDAFLILCKYPAKFTKADEEAITKFKLIFGEAVGQYGLIVFTGGDTYRNEMLDNEEIPCFKSYIEDVNKSASKTDEKLSKVLNFYKGGWILIDNFEKDKVKMDRQMNELLALVDGISQSKGGKYNQGIFEEVRTKVEKYKSKNPKYTEENLKRYQQKIAEEIVNESGACFPGKSMVIRYPGEKIAISQVSDGDQILVMHRDGSIGYDTIYMQGHNDADTTMNAVTLTTSTGEQLTASYGHFIFVTDSNTTKRMCDVTVGDYVLVVHDKSHGYQMTSERVTKKQHTTAHGMYNPMTLSGTIVVDHIFATNYEEHIQPVVAHLMLAPVRGLYRVAPGIVRAVNSYTYRGVPVWAYSVMAVSTWITDIKARVKWELF